MASPDNAMVHTSPPSSDKVGVETIEKAVNALLRWHNATTPLLRWHNATTQYAQLFKPGDLIYLMLIREEDGNKADPSESCMKTYNIPLPHSLNLETKLCLIIDDRAESSLTSEAAKTKIKDENIPIKKVIRLSKLKNSYKHYKSKRMLYDSYDMFFADTGVIPLLPRWLGKKKFAKKKISVPVDLGDISWKEQIERACSSTILCTRTGAHSLVKVGKASMEKEDIVENVVSAVEESLGLIPGKWEGIRSLHLQFANSFSFPLYQAWQFR